MSDAISGVGTVFRKWDGVSSWDNIAEITNINGPSMSRDLIEVTNLNTTGGFREFIAGFRDGGTIVVSMNYTRTSLDLMFADFEDDDTQNYEIVLPDTDATSLEFEGLVQEVPLTISTDSQITLEVTIKITGAVTVNSGSNVSAP